MQFINSLVTWLNFKRLYQIDLFKKFPFDVQRETLIKLVDKAKNTVYGKQYDFNSIKSIEEFQQRVPIQDYDGVKPYIERLLKGEQNILWPSEIRWFAKSSGTTNDKSKFIPVSREALEDCHFRGGKDILAVYTTNYPETGIFSGKGLTLGGSHQINKINNESFYGDLSAILIENLPFWANFIKTPSQEIALLSEWEEKLDKITHATIKENVTSIAGVPSWTLVLIKYILEKTGKNNLLEVWPNLELFNHGGVSFEPYKEQFKKLIPSEKMNYMETYNASEGFFAIQDYPTRNDMLLMLDYGIFYEFIPMDQLDKEHPKALHIGDVEQNKNYAVVISTNGGLWRYLIGDTIVFTSLYPHKIKISGRTKHFINAFGEEIIIENAENALKEACEKTGALIKDYTAAPIFMNDNQKGGHQWLIEFEKEPDNPARFSEFLDLALQKINSDYEAKRYKDITLDKPVLTIAKKRLFYIWLKNKGKVGGQNKVPRLANTRKYMDELITLNNQL
ncbi:MAG TPA: GH3 auxin-responsive promoter family protein [Bacteroidales bacterium]|nr:GH3 auxin-responsive promoter family protein [Bacteroidales bacterium]